MKRLLLTLIILAAACGSGAPAFAQDPAPSDPVRFGFSTYTAIALGRPDTKVRYWLQADVQGPLVVGSKAIGDLGGSASIETLPAKADTATGDIADLGSWGNVATFSGWAGRRVGDASFGTQHISTSIVAEGEVATAFFDSAAEPLRKRFYRGFGGGVQVTLHLTDRDAYFRMTYGRDEAVGPLGVGQLRLAAEVPVPALKGARIKARVGLGLGALSKSGDQTDYVLVGIGKPW